MSAFQTLDTNYQRNERAELVVRRRALALEEARHVAWRVLGPTPEPRYFGLSFPNFMIALALGAFVIVILVASIIETVATIMAVCILGIVVILLARMAVERDCQIMRRKRRGI